MNTGDGSDGGGRDCVTAMNDYLTGLVVSDDGDAG